MPGSSRFSRAWLVLSLLLVLVGCSGSAIPRLTQRVLSVAAGSYDDQSTSKVAVSAFRTEIIWAAGLPALKASRVTVRYDVHERSLSWQLVIHGTPYRLTQLAGTDHLLTLGRYHGDLVQEVESGALQGVVARTGHGRVLLDTQAYLVHYDVGLDAFVNAHAAGSPR